jgi:hypothetical protein
LEGFVLYNPEQAARVAYAAVRQLREEQGGERGPVWSLLVHDERVWYLRFVELVMTGRRLSLIHDEWYQELSAAGWREGPKIDHAKRMHPDLLPWTTLAEHVQRRLYVIQMITLGLYLEVPPAVSEVSSSSRLPAL